MKIEIFAAFEKKELAKEVKKLNVLIDKGRIPISGKSVQQVPWNNRVKTFDNIVCERSANADLVIMGFSLDKITDQKGEYFKMFASIKDMLFVRAGQKIMISEV